MSSFRWWRRLRGGKWAKVTGLMWGHRWILVPDSCRERIDEHWIDITLQSEFGCSVVRVNGLTWPAKP